MAKAVPRLAWDAPGLWKYIEDDIPVVITNCPLISSVSGSWTPEHLCRIIDANFPNTVYASNSTVFQYWNSKTDVYEFTEPTEKVDLTFRDFLAAMKNGAVPDTSVAAAEALARTHAETLVEQSGAGASDAAAAIASAASAAVSALSLSSSTHVPTDGAADSAPVSPPKLSSATSRHSSPAEVNATISELDEAQKEKRRKYFYMQQSLVAEMGPLMMEEFQKFSLETAVLFKKAGQWDNLSNNLLLVGPQGATTPCHFDEQQNLFAQLHGSKRVRLFPPAAWPRLYPFPTWHPCDRQIQLTLPVTPGSQRLDDEADNIRFPAFSQLTGPEYQEQVTILQPGELLFLPQYWFHQMEALSDNTSLSWWFVCTSRKKHGDVAQLRIHHADPLKVAFRRNLEKLFVTMMNNDLASTHNLFCAIASGRVNLPRNLLVAPLDGRSPPTMVEQDPPPPVIAPDQIDPSSSSSAVAIPQAWDDVVGRISHTIAAVLPAGTVGITLRELTAGRFNGLRIS